MEVVTLRTTLSRVMVPDIFEFMLRDLIGNFLQIGQR